MNAQFAQRFGFYCKEVLSGKHRRLVIASDSDFLTLFKSPNIIAVELQFAPTNAPGDRTYYYFYRTVLEEINIPRILAGRRLIHVYVWDNTAEGIDEEAAYRDYKSLRNED